MSYFKVGDRVRRTKDCSFAFAGDLGTVLAVNPSGSLVVQMDNGHKCPNCSSKKVELVTPRSTAGNSKETKMTKRIFGITIEQQTLINGAVITPDTSDEELYEIIATAEEEIKRLEKIEHKPDSLQARIDGLKKGIEGVVDICNARSK